MQMKVLNGILAKNMKVLPLKYNITSLSVYFNIDEVTMYRKPSFHYSEIERDESLTDARIIHFTSTFMDVRPWVKGSKHPYAVKWKKIKEQSLWSDFTQQEDNRNLQKKMGIYLALLLPKKIRIFITGIIHAYIKPLKYVLRRL